MTKVKSQEHVEAVLNYLDHDGRRPVNYTYPPPEGVPQQSHRVIPHRVRIQNARELAHPPTLDSHGFELFQAGSEHTDFAHDAQIRASYYPESQALIKRLTGAEHVVIFDHTLRLDSKDHAEEGVREPVRRVHNDQTFISGPRRVRDHVPASELGARLAQRHAIINLWRPIGEPVQTAPLALCDARSIAEGDLVSSDLVYRDKVGETYSFQHNPAHRWFYFPLVRPDEVVLLKIYDSRTDAARLTAHTAFDDPNTPPEAPPRRSIELRTLVFWPTLQ
jgi:hypothetical protein